MTMITTWASLAVAEKQIQEIGINQDPLITSIFLELTTAVALAEAYSKIWNSIYWQTSRKATKERVSNTLNRIAFSINTHTLNAMTLFNEYCDLMATENLLENPYFPQWKKLHTSLYLAHRGLKEWHSHQINSQQLHLWEKFN